MVAGPLLKVHGVLEVVAGIAMIVVTTKVFPFTASAGIESQYLGKSFGVAILALGLTALISRPSSGLLFGALAYHTSISSLMFRQVMEGSTSDATGVTAAAGFHGILAVIFAFTWIKWISRKKKIN